MEADLAAFAAMQRHLDGPGWRWLLAQRAARRDVSGRLAEADGLVAQAADYLRLTAQGDGGRFMVLAYRDSVEAVRRAPAAGIRIVHGMRGRACPFGRS